MDKPIVKELLLHNSFKPLDLNDAKHNRFMVMLVMEMHEFGNLEEIHWVTDEHLYMRFTILYMHYGS